MTELPDNLSIYDASWDSWLDMKRYGPASRWLRALIRDACRQLPDRPTSVHDVGCGEGTTTVFLADLFPESKIRGSDFSETGVRVAALHAVRHNLHFVHDPHNTALDSVADLVCCFEVLEHVEDWRGFLARLANSAQRYVLVSFPTGRMRPFEVNIGHLRNFEPGEVERAMRALYFEPMSIAYAGFPFYSPLYRNLCQLTNAGDADFTRGTYGYGKRAIGSILYFAFRYLSTQRAHGDQFVGLFHRNGS